MIYLDYSSTTPLDKRVLKEMLPFLKSKYGNPSSIHLKGRTAKSAVDLARKRVSKVLNCKTEEIIFTGSGTESDNLAVLGYAKSLAVKSIHGAFLCSEIEHHAVLDSSEKTSALGFSTDLIPVKRSGVVDMQWLEKRLNKGDVKFVSVMYVNNEIGTIQPIKEISGLCKKHGIILHTDACQASAYLDLDVQKLGVDLLTFNGSKVYGPKGIGALFVKEGIDLEPIVYGGGQENGLRSGTENVPGIVGLGKAMEIASKERNKDGERIEKLRDRLIEGLSKIPDAVLNGDIKNRVPNNVNFSFRRVEGESILLKLDEAGIYVSTGSACSSRSLDPSHVIQALYIGDKGTEYAHGSIRFSFGRFTKPEDIYKTVKETTKIIFELREISAMK